MSLLYIVCMPTLYNLLILILLFFLDAFVLLSSKIKIYFNYFVDVIRNRKDVEKQLKNRIKKKMERIDLMFGLNIFSNTNSN